MALCNRCSDSSRGPLSADLIRRVHAAAHPEARDETEPPGHAQRDESSPRHLRQAPQTPVRGDPVVGALGWRGHSVASPSASPSTVWPWSCRQGSPLGGADNCRSADAAVASSACAMTSPYAWTCSMGQYSTEEPVSCAASVSGWEWPPGVHGAYDGQATAWPWYSWSESDPPSGGLFVPSPGSSSTPAPVSAQKQHVASPAARRTLCLGTPSTRADTPGTSAGSWSSWSPEETGRLKLRLFHGGSAGDDGGGGESVAGDDVAEVPAPMRVEVSLAGFLDGSSSVREF